MKASKLFVAFACVLFCSDPIKCQFRDIINVALYYGVGGGFNFANKQYGKYLAHQVLNANGTIATVIADDSRHILNAAWRHVMASTYLTEANNYLKNPGESASEADRLNYQYALANTVGREATLAGLAYEAGRSCLAIYDMNTAAMSLFDTLRNYDSQKMDAQKMIALSDNGNVTHNAVSREPSSFFSVNSWQGAGNAVAHDPLNTSLVPLYIAAGLMVHWLAQLTGPAVRAIATNKNKQAMALNQEPWFRAINTLTAYPLTVFAKPYVLSALASGRSYVGLKTNDSSLEQVYDAAYATGDKSLFGYYGLKAAWLVLTMLLAKVQAQLHHAHAH